MLFAFHARPPLSVLRFPALRSLTMLPLRLRARYRAPFSHDATCSCFAVPPLAKALLYPFGASRSAHAPMLATRSCVSCSSMPALSRRVRPDHLRYCHHSSSERCATTVYFSGYGRRPVLQQWQSRSSPHKGVTAALVWGALVCAPWSCSVALLCRASRLCSCVSLICCA